MSIGNLHSDHVDIIGTVMMARVNEPKMSISIGDGREIETSFSYKDEKNVLKALAEHEEARIHLIGEGIYDATGNLQSVTRIDRIDFLPCGHFEYDTSAKPIWEEISDIVSTIPKEAFDKLPTDGAEKHDHYLYGNPN